MVTARWRAHGDGDPVTLVVPGLGATPGEARVPASGLPGTRVVVTFPSHGDAPPAPPDYWSYPRLAAEVLAVADAVGATRAVGTSLGAGALTRLVAEHPDRFDRLVLLLPAAVDRPRATPAVWALERLAEAVDHAERTGDTAPLRELVAAELPSGVPVGDYVDQRSAVLLRLGAALRALPDQVPLAGLGDAASALAAVRAPALVVGATRDPLHAEQVAKATAAALPEGRLELVDSPAPLVTHRRELRALITAFLAEGHG
ncbi:Pimeloyl-ACP methyl ester carboxylesterase [Streptoalloteichus tenebrarius]|uniref:Pimeloyl-ACP methyl ester carboxylesterase n=1 Tax=Streptoalloteichus tenebrarius (strain ATCC 17920 / DSM 40477 / JCM 4838 / CBS 697.72 / NBRC 16177 / NCIMB 11028 / NRRL B-12390 / A12253. 1 / ISP 5477) TaxID=1933 RepID=A0ABT1HVA8_STRSD|nr:alpha/beta hydrolase [Streptoalloteichus tenebrarius]MCP2259453.1 Pimeloyl-ACP methyl ester carboxylesterase [Streptoalloteichus tenebrarius]BFF02395.1 alpha/beta hydrolase [Streptoalloteichus tenebrarius]